MFLQWCRNTNPGVKYLIAQAICAGSVRSTSGTTSETSPSGQEFATVQASDNDWRTHVNSAISYKPSVLSPLHSVYNEYYQLNSKFRYVELALKAEEQLSGCLEQRNDKGITIQLQQRAERSNRLVALLDQLQQRDPIQLSSRLDRIYGFYEALRNAADALDSSQRQFSKVLTGDVDPWEYWLQEFEHKYDKVPSLEPLEVLYNKPDPEAEVNALRLKAMQEAKRLAVRRLRNDHWSAPEIRSLLESSSSQANTLAAPSNSPQVAEKHAARRHRIKHAVGRRKTASATVALWPGTGCIMVNGKPYDEYFHDYFNRHQMLRPLFVTGSTGKYNAAVSVRGGGISGQSQAVRHAMAKALHKMDSSTGPVLAQHSSGDLLRRDPRTVERKKPGRAKARKSFAWVKR